MRNRRIHENYNRLDATYSAGSDRHVVTMNYRHYQPGRTQHQYAQQKTDLLYLSNAQTPTTQAILP
ncbi:hypothetical protein [Methylicorpusculum sp.]|uniref:hypothetical protein n=1 Tax=Methylicorpusculum sp. TaxID=2713644 RepID=UPI002732A0B3|nr:hypothetical protein [Methylicorpusculum sp.]MDP3529352.1 hypothetical protein [Methylicorpusculum sp.]MDZ4154404.1 hypothetical protein [Methylicorpusculum sp.]